MFSQLALRLALLPAVALMYAAAASPSLAIDLGVGAGGGGISVGVGGGSGQGGVNVTVDGDGLHVNGPDGGGASAGSGSSAPPSAEPQRLGQEGALEAVRSKRALPLEDILQRARVVVDGEIIDAQLISLRSILLYQLKVLGKGGDVSQLYFYARSGLPVQAD